MPFSAVLLGLKEPRPPLHTPPEAPATLPFSAMVALLAQTELLAPAFTEGAAVKASVIGLATALHPPLPVVVRVSVTEPPAISAAVGV